MKRTKLGVRVVPRTAGMMVQPHRDRPELRLASPTTEESAVQRPGETHNTPELQKRETKCQQAPNTYRKTAASKRNTLTQPFGAINSEYFRFITMEQRMSIIE